MAFKEAEKDEKKLLEKKNVKKIFFFQKNKKIMILRLVKMVIGVVFYNGLQKFHLFGYGCIPVKRGANPREKGVSHDEGRILRCQVSHEN